jgi:predicted membrane protein (TIGR00267 family)
MGFREALRLSGGGEIVRRYFVLNAFDGVLTMLGLVVGAHAAGAGAPQVAGAALGAMVAMAVSGFSGAFLTEGAERKATLHELETAMLRDLDQTAHGRAARTSALVTALVNGASPTLGAATVFIPFALGPAPLGAFAAMGAALAVLLGLGLYLARVAEEVPWKYGAKMVGVGLATAGILLLMEGVF